MKFAWVALSVWSVTNLALAQIPQPTDAPRPMTPEQSAAAFKVPDGFRVEVVASDPLIASPSAVCWDERGRMFVSELHGYNLEGQLDIEELNKTGQLDTQVRRVEAGEKFKQAAKSGTYGVVKMLTSSKGDGRMDNVQMWATNLPPIYGLVPARGGIIVACAPQIVFLADRDGDAKPDVREVLFEGFAVGEMWRGINCPLWSADGWIYFSQGWPGGEITGPKLANPMKLRQSDFRIRADGSAIESVTGSSGTFGFAVTETGDPHAYARSRPHPWRQKRADDPEYFKYYNSRYAAAESEADGWFTAACGPLVYRDSALPGLRGQYFVCEPSLNLIHRAALQADGPLLRTHRVPGEEKSEFMASTDVWSHPINLVHGPDGAIWIVDYYREIIEDYSAIPRRLQQQYGVYAGHDRGRIYRLTHREAPTAPAADMSKLDTKALAQECASPLFWRRQTAQRLLSERGDAAAAPELREQLASPNAEPSSLIATLRTLDGYARFHSIWAHQYLHADSYRRAMKLDRALQPGGIGYRFVLTSTNWESGLRADETLTVRQEWANRNAGWCAYPYGLKLYLQTQKGRTAWSGVDKAFDPRRWWSGTNYAMESLFRLPGDLKQGNYELCIALVDASETANVRLGTVGADDQKRCKLGAITISDERK